jgi:uncharacterized heparinase superfamily protein
VLWHTLRHLRGRQILGQVRKRLRDRFVDPTRFAKRPAPPFPGCAWTLAGDPLAPGVPCNTAGSLKDGRFRFVNHEVSLGWPPRWECPEQTRLWQYNLHYFDWLWSLDYAGAREVVEDWIRRHALARRRVGWEPFPVSLRLQNWLALFFGRFRRQTEADTRWTETLWPSIFLQAEWLSRNLEYHLLANHLLENAVALTWVGACFAGEDAQRWRRKGLELLAKELDEQILPDGMHFERSPMYHLRALYLVVLLSTVDRPILRLPLAPVLERMIDATECLLHPDGQIALFNDSAFGIANDPRSMIEAGRDRSGRFEDSGSPGGPWSLPEAGYFGFRADGIYLICDAGPMGPDYMLGHAHGDLLSFELSLDGHRAIVDGGVYSYESDEMRPYCRSTRAHNTVEIDARDQAEFWSVFRVGRRARPSYVDWEPSEEGFRLSGRHDGYTRLPGSPTHQRTFDFERPATLEIRDTVHSARPVRVASRIHLHPDCSVEELSETTASVRLGATGFRLIWSGAVEELIREESWYCPQFAVRERNTCLTCLSFGSQVETKLRIERV